MVRSSGTSGAERIAIRQFVLHGFPTTATRRSSAAWSLSARPWPVKIGPFSRMRSPRSMPLPRGLLPTSRAQLTSLKPSFGSEVRTRSCSRGNAQSSSSIATPFKACIGFSNGTSTRCRITGWSGPNICPLAMRGSRA